MEPVPCGASQLARPPLAAAADPAPPTSTRAAVESSETPLPLNSRRLTGPYLRSIAKVVGLLMTGSVDKLRMIIEGKLTEMGRDPRNVHVIVTKDPRGREMLALRDVDDVFVDSGSLENPDAAGTVDGSGEDGGESGTNPASSSDDASTHAAKELDELRAQNAELLTSTTELRAQVTSLEEEVSEVRGKLKEQTERVNEIWRVNCAQVTGFNVAITAKDCEMELLRARIAELEASRGERHVVPTLEPTMPTGFSAHPLKPVASGHTEPASLALYETRALAPARRGQAPPKAFLGKSANCKSRKRGLVHVQALICS